MAATNELSTPDRRTASRGVPSPYDQDPAPPQQGTRYAHRLRLLALDLSTDGKAVVMTLTSGTTLLKVEKVGHKSGECALIRAIDYCSY